MKKGVKMLKRVCQIKNAHGINVKRCCLSCQFKGYSAEGDRICEKTGKKVKANNICPLWQMSEGAELAGYNRGPVKTKRYLIYRRKYMEQIGEGRDTDSLKEVRREYEEQYGSVYEIE